MPSHVDRRFVVSLVLNRNGSGVGDRAAPFGPAVALLTAREREVLDWVAAGKTNRDIAAILGASRRTVEKHLEHVYEKLGVETRTAAVMRVCGWLQRTRYRAVLPAFSTVRTKKGLVVA